jgi:phosphatidylglycerol:prolipoprotein diacylglycerol transferase
MERTVSFPALNLKFSLAREALSIGPITVYWYGIIIVTGIILGCLVAINRSRRYGVHPDKMLDILLYSVIAAFVGARAYYVAFTWDYYSAHPEEIFQIWLGGIALYGSVIAAFAMAAWLCRRWKVSFLHVGDAAVPGLILGQAIGRWGNFVNMEAFGTNTTLPWGMTGTDITNYLMFHRDALADIGVFVDPAAPVHPTFLYESLWCFVGFFLLLWISKSRRFLGEIILLYAGWYSLGRAWIEGLRTDSLMAGNLRVSQGVAVAIATSAVLAWVVLFFRTKKGNLPPTLLVPDTQTLLAQAEAMAPQTKAAVLPDETSVDEAASQPASDDVSQKAAEKPLLSDEPLTQADDEQTKDAKKQEPAHLNKDSTDEPPHA